MKSTIFTLCFALAVVVSPCWGNWSNDSAVTFNFTDVTYYQHPKAATDSAGNIYVVCDRRKQVGLPDQIALFRSTDGGVTWTYSIAFNIKVNNIDADTYHPDIAVYRSGSTTNGVVVMHYIDPLNGDFEVASRSFEDNGSFTWYDAQAVPTFIYSETDYRPVVTYTGDYFVCALLGNYYDMGDYSYHAKIEICVTGSHTGSWVNQGGVNLGAGMDSYIPEHPDIDTLIDGTNAYVYYTYFRRISFSNDRHNIRVLRSTNHGLSGSWSYMTGTPENISIDEIDPSLACTKDDTGQKVVLVYSSEQSSIDYDIKYMIAGKNDTAFGAASFLNDTTTNDIQPRIQPDPAVTGHTEKFRITWFQDDTSDDKIMYSDCYIGTPTPSFSVSEQVDDANSSPWDGWDAAFNSTEVTWRGTAAEKEPIVFWLDNRNQLPNQATPAVYCSYKAAGSPVPTYTPIPTETPTPIPTETYTPAPTDTSTPVGTATPSPTAAPLCEETHNGQAGSVMFTLSGCPDHDVRMLFHQFSGTGDIAINVKGYDQEPPNIHSSKALNFYWEITPGSGISSFKVDLNFSLSSNDLPVGMDLSDIDGIFRYDSNSSRWLEVTGAFDQANMLLKVRSVTAFSVWGIGERETFEGEPVPSSNTWALILMIVALSLFIIHHRKVLIQ